MDPPAVGAHVEIGAVNGIYSHGLVTLDCGTDAIEASYRALSRPDEPVHRQTLSVAQV